MHVVLLQESLKVKKLLCLLDETTDAPKFLVIIEVLELLLLEKRRKDLLGWGSDTAFRRYTLVVVRYGFFPVPD